MKVHHNLLPTLCDIIPPLGLSRTLTRQFPSLFWTQHRENYYGTTYRLKNSVDPLDPLHAEGNLSVADLWPTYDWVRRKIRLIGAGYWRKGKRIYEKNQKN